MDQERAPGSSHENDPEPAPLGEHGITTSHRIWLKVRPGLQACELAFALTEHEALAAGTRALVIMGDLLF